VATAHRLPAIRVCWLYKGMYGDRIFSRGNRGGAGRYLPLDANHSFKPLLRKKLAVVRMATDSQGEEYEHCLMLTEQVKPSGSLIQDFCPGLID
jgi:hypothetical protein